MTIVAIVSGMLVLVVVDALILWPWMDDPD